MDSHSLLIGAPQPDNVQKLLKDLSAGHVVQRSRDEQQGGHLSSCCSSGAREREMGGKGEVRASVRRYFLRSVL